MCELLGKLHEEISHAFEDWIIRGFIDGERMILAISQDTKLLSKVFELRISPMVKSFADSHDLKMLPARAQNTYPDYSLQGDALEVGEKWIALDIKSSYRKGARNERISGFTLGTFRGYLREQTSTRYSTLPYEKYASHWCLCVVYDRSPAPSEGTRYSLDEIDSIPPVVGNFEVHLHQKYQLASETPGSGNTTNIGSVKELEAIRKGTGPFSELGEEVFEDYWRNYLRKKDEGPRPQRYRNIEEYRKWKKRKGGDK